VRAHRSEPACLMDGTTPVNRLQTDKLPASMLPAWRLARASTRALARAWVVRESCPCPL